MNESILIVEDEPEFAALLERWITQSGYTPMLARTGNEALRNFYEQHPDLVVLDVSVPGLDGWQVIQFPNQLAPFDDREIDILGYEFILQQMCEMAE